MNIYWLEQCTIRHGSVMFLQSKPGQVQVYSAKLPSLYCSGIEGKWYMKRQIWGVFFTLQKKIWHIHTHHCIRGHSLMDQTWQIIGNGQKIGYFSLIFIGHIFHLNWWIQTFCPLRNLPIPLQILPKFALLAPPKWSPFCHPLGKRPAFRSRCWGWKRHLCLCIRHDGEVWNTIRLWILLLDYIQCIARKMTQHDTHDDSMKDTYLMLFASSLVAMTLSCTAQAVVKPNSTILQTTRWINLMILPIFLRSLDIIGVSKISVDWICMYTYVARTFQSNTKNMLVCILEYLQCQTNTGLEYCLRPHV